MKMNKKIAASVAFCFCAAVVFADDVYWSAPVDGDWSDDTKWSTGIAPTQADNAFITVAGTYTVTLSGIAPGPIVVGCGMENSGTQTLKLTGSQPTVKYSITIAKSGVVENYCQQLRLPSNAYIHVMDGGAFLQKYQGNSQFHGNRWFKVDEGGILDIAQGSSIELNEGTGTDTNSYSVINGRVTGQGKLKYATGYPGIIGHGVVGDAGSLIEIGTAYFAIGEGLVINKDIVKTGTGNNSLWFQLSGTNVLNGDIVYTNPASSSYSVTGMFHSKNDVNMTLIGSGNTYLSYTGVGRFGVQPDQGGNNKLTLAQTGETKVWLNGFTVKINALELNIKTKAGFFGDNGILLVGHRAHAAKTALNILNGGVMTVSDAVFRFDFGNNNQARSSHAIVHQNGEMVWHNVAMEGAYHSAANVNNFTYRTRSLQLLDGGTLTLKSANSIDRNTQKSENGNTSNSSCVMVRFNEGGAIDVEEGASLRIANAVVENFMTNNWGFAAAGTLELSTNVTMTALSEDNGARVHPKLEPMFIKTLALSGDEDVTVTMTANGDKTVWYAGTLDLSAMPAGSSLDLAGNDAIVYYVNLDNPNNVAFDSAKWVKAREIHDGTIIMLR